MRLFLLIYLIFCPILALAEEEIVIDQLLRTNFEPTKSNLIYNDNQLNLMPAELLKLEQGDLLLIATLPAKTEVKNYAFALSDDNGNFYATPFVNLNTKNNIKTYKEKLSKKNGFLQNRITFIRSERDKLKEENQALEKEFGDRVNLKEIIDLKTKLENINISIDFHKQVKEDLNQLIENRNNRTESKDLAANSRILSQHLSDAAKVTAAAERLSIKKKETALSRFKQQLRAIEEMQQADLPAMAKQLIELRKARGKLENNTDSTNQF